MNTRYTKWMVLLLIPVAVAACAQQPARTASGDAAHAKIDYAKYVRGTVPWFHFSSLYSWDSRQLDHVVVWTGPRKAYRLALSGPCIGLRSAVTIGLTSHDGLVSANRDAVIVRRRRCSIMRIDRLDAKAIRAVQAKSKAKDDKGG